MQQNSQKRPMIIRAIITASLLFAGIAQAEPSGLTKALLKVLPEDALSKQPVPNIPEGAVRTTNPLIVEPLGQFKDIALMVYRQNPNKPEVVSDDFIRGVASNEDAKKYASGEKIIAYLPTVKILPCAQGCSGEDYEEAANAFKNQFNTFANPKHESNKNFKPRGEFVVQVSTYKRRSFLERRLPLGEDAFGVSFALEGKLVTLTMGSGNEGTVDEVAQSLASKLMFDLIQTVGLGIRPWFVQPAKEVQSETAKVVVTALDGVSTGLSKLGYAMGGEYVAPLGPEHSALLPAMDGILPNEVLPVDKKTDSLAFGYF
ncbi:hypothetical protein [Crenobacter intestini]|uniref:Uncharacterized protein n=1 Tax=Crenobacter intestini TaxID=2563443 RepID=A0A4T0UP44_9NEIS|nr:hypothetical protein [Crenobacter intestini]TIC80306.1 hypothetical protein E5K04_12430 [Crenobacter intestini]